ncbi:MAG: cell wall-binding repeat-containing protein, partial [Erysipelotrichaceae bacterium]|nr:cell wall-binding repeat-containing protein [Erysipelotrichaceae bacterium]
GGNNAVKPVIESQLKSYGSVRRIMGANRAGTSIEIAKEFFPESKQAVVAYSHNFPDGLCGGPLAHQINAPLILTRDNDADATAAYLKSKGISNGYVLGGTSVLSDALVRKLYAMRSSDKIIVFE